MLCYTRKHTHISIVLRTTQRNVNVFSVWKMYLNWTNVSICKHTQSHWCMCIEDFFFLLNFAENVDKQSHIDSKTHWIIKYYSIKLNESEKNAHVSQYDRKKKERPRPRPRPYSNLLEWLDFIYHYICNVVHDSTVSFEIVRMYFI